MKKSELKNIIKECVKEVIFEEGVLSGIITEVAQGLSASVTATSAPTTLGSSPSRPNTPRLAETKRKVLDAVGGHSYENIKKKFSNPALFEGTTPLPAEGGQGALSGVSPHDSGIDISKLPGMNAWSSIANGKR